MSDPTKIIVEYRPRIRSCQFFIRSPHLRSNETDVRIENNQVLLESAASILYINVGVSVNLILNSISGLHFSNDSIYFRCRTSPSKIFGSFSTEFMLTQNSSLISNDFLTERYTPNISIHKSVGVFCRSCSTPILSTYCNFNRILPIPTSTNLSDFFCHLPHDSSCSSSTNISLQPKETDCLYRQYYVILNKKLLRRNEEKIEIKQCEIFNCSKCLSWLGTVDESTVKLWNSTTLFCHIDEETLDIPVHDTTINNNVALADFISIIKESIEDSAVGIPSKLILTCKVSATENHYLLIWVMDRSLTILTRDEQISSAPNIPEVNENFKINFSLKEKKVIKCLYYFSESFTDMIEKWNKLLETSTVEISKQMLTQGLQHLEEMSDCIPLEFRTATDMNVTYIMK